MAEAERAQRGAIGTRQVLTASGAALARWIAAGEISSREVLEIHIERILRTSGRLNAMVARRFEVARAEADAADEAVARGDALGPLHGVPCSIKESFALQGMPHSGGLWSRREVRAEADAVTVARLRAAGAIPMGVTNVPELCMWYETTNTIYGRTSNAYHPEHIAGGSSGGEGALVGAGASPFGLGSDIGGSIRMPAFFNGVFGHKPTGGLVPSSGQFPQAHGAARTYLATGPLTRRAEDLWPLLQLLAGPDGEDDSCVPTPLPVPSPERLALERVLIVSPHDRLPVSRELRDAQEDAAQVLAAASGARVETVAIEGLRRAFEIWGAHLEAAGGPSFAALMGGGREIAVGVELLRWAMGRSHHTLPALMLALGERLFSVSARHIEQMLAAGRALKEEFDALLDARAVMLFAPFPRVAPKHNAPLLRPFDFTYTAILNIMALPVTQVPMGLNARGLPLGVQVVGAHAHDALTIACAGALEEARGGWVPPHDLS